MLHSQNILVQIPQPNWYVKIADFGISRKIHNSPGITAGIGTQSYMAPEAYPMFSHKSNLSTSESHIFALDMWALGTIIWRMMTTQFPFPGIEDLATYINATPSSPLSLKFEGLSKDCINFVEASLAIVPEERLTSTAALQSNWLESYKARVMNTEPTLPSIEEITLTELTRDTEPDVYQTWSTTAQTIDNLPEGEAGFLTALETPIPLEAEKSDQVRIEEEDVSIEAVEGDMSDEPSRENEEQGDKPTIKKGNGDNDLTSGGNLDMSKSRSKISERTSKLKLSKGSQKRQEENQHNNSGGEESVLDADPTSTNSLKEYNISVAQVDETAESSQVDDRPIEIKRQPKRDDEPTDSTVKGNSRDMVEQAVKKEKTSAAGTDGTETNRILTKPAELDILEQTAEKLFDKEEFEAAESCYRRLLKARQEIQGSAHEATLFTMSELGKAIAWGVYNTGKKKNLREAERLCRESRRALEKKFGRENHNTLRSAHTLGSLLIDLKKYTEAEEIYRWVVSTRHKLLGKNDESTLASIFNLGLVFLRTNKYKKSLQRFRWCVEGYGALFGEHSVDTLDSLHEIGVAFYNQDKWADAENSFRKLLRGREITYGKEHELTLATLLDLGDTVYELGRKDECWTLLKRCIQGREKAFGAKDSRTKTVKARYKELKKHAAAS